MFQKAWAIGMVRAVKPPSRAAPTQAHLSVKTTAMVPTSSVRRVKTAKTSGGFRLKWAMVPVHAPKPIPCSANAAQNGVVRMIRARIWNSRLSVIAFTQLGAMSYPPYGRRSQRRRASVR